MVTTERDHLADGEVEQAIIPGCAPVSASARAIARERQLRALRRGHNLPMAAGGLFDDVARAQQDLF